MKCFGLGVVADPDARVLILGTLPGTESLERGEYYAKKTNAFWGIMGELVGASPEMEYEQRLNVLKRKGIALWDVCRSAERLGSLDSRIIAPTVVLNDFDSFLATHSHIRVICFNGRLAEKTLRRFNRSANISRIRCEVLPSTSSAHTVARNKKVSAWRKALGEFIDLSPTREVTEN